jgi:uncharacterized cupredoxin-like copper-binding protein
MEIASKIRQNLTRLTILTVLLTALSLGLAACGGDTTTGGASQPAVTAATSTPEMAMTDTTTTPAADTSGQAAATSTAATASSGSTGGATTQVQGTLREWAIDLSQSEVPAGTVQFSVTNTGMMRHNFTVLDASGNEVGRTPDFAGSEGAQTLQVTLQPGTYTIICSLPGHAQRGQKTQLVVK